MRGALWFCCALCIAVLRSSIANDEKPRPRYTNSWVVEIHGGPEAAAAMAHKYGFINRGQVGKLKDIYHFVLPEKDGKNKGLPNSESQYRISNSLRLETNVGLVEQQVLRKRVKKGYVPPTDPDWTQQWSLFNTGQSNAQNNADAGNDLNVEPAWIQGYTGCNVTVGVVDDGVGYTHPDLKPNYASSLGYDYVEGDDDPFPAGPYGHCNGDHGTCCAGAIAMAKNNGVCGVGVAHQSTITGIRLLGYFLTDIKEVDALTHKNDVIEIYSNSWGPVDSGTSAEKPTKIVEMALENGVNEGRDGKGSIFVWAAGNGGDNDDSCAADGYASSIYTIAVGSAASDGTQAYYDENCSGKMAVVFVNNPHSQDSVTSTTADGHCHHNFDGTSAATPLVSGVLALVLEVNSSLTWRDVQYLIAYTSNPDILSGGTWTENGAGLRVSHQFGFGAIDAEAIVTRARHWINVPEQQLDTVVPATDSGELESESTLDVEFIYDGNIQFLEHVVVTAGLYFNDISDGLDPDYDYFLLHLYLYEYFFNNDDTDYYDYTFPGFSSLKELLQSGSRGDIQLELTSPEGTRSVVLPYRNYDLLPAGYYSWPFMSVHFWGEDPNGMWILTIRYRGENGTVSFGNLTATFHGTYNIPEAVSRIPDECHQACARGCSAAGSQFCDTCADGFLRDAKSLQCIDPDECPTDYAIRSGYCYDSRTQEHACNRTVYTWKRNAAISITEGAYCLVMALTFTLAFGYL